jgi:hypothetical protein
MTIELIGEVVFWGEQNHSRKVFPKECSTIPFKYKEFITSVSILETAFRVFSMFTIIYYSCIYGFLQY